MEILKIYRPWRRKAYRRSTALIIFGVILIIFGIFIIIIGPNSPQEFFHSLQKFYSPYLYYSRYSFMGGIFILPGVLMVIGGVLIKTKYSYWKEL